MNLHKKPYNLFGSVDYFSYLCNELKREGICHI